MAFEHSVVVELEALTIFLSERRQKKATPNRKLYLRQELQDLVSFFFGVGTAQWKLSFLPQLRANTKTLMVQPFATAINRIEISPRCHQFMITN